RVEPGRERIRLQQPEAEAVDRRDPGAVELAREVVAASVEQLAPDAPPQLPSGALRVRDHEHRADVDPFVTDRVRDSLDEPECLPRACSRRDEDVAARLDRRPLLLVWCARAHARFTRHIRQSEEHTFELQSLAYL